MKTRTLTISHVDTDDPLIREAGQALADGALVVFPTETVYGLGASAVHPNAIQDLDSLKDRDPGKPFALHLADPEEAARYAGPLPPLAARLIRRVWPGPLTLVVPDRREDPGLPEGLVANAVYYEGTVGLRCPDHAVGRAILRAAGCPVVATSANLRGDPPPRTAREALAALGDRVPLLVDGGPAKCARPSTVVRLLGDDSYEVLREGAITERRLERLAKTTILMVCTGNMCRSPMAVGLARHLLADRLGYPPDELANYGFRIASAGTASVAGAGASANAVLAMAERGIDIRRHRSRPISVDVLRATDYIWVMTQGHRQAVLRVAPDVADHVDLIDPEGHEVPDPVGGDLDLYRACARHLEEALAKRMREIV